MTLPIKANDAVQNTKSVKEATDGIEKPRRKKWVDQGQQSVCHTAEAKNNEAYAEAKRKLDDANTAIKNRIKLGEEDSNNCNSAECEYYSNGISPLTKNKQV